MSDLLKSSTAFEELLFLDFDGVLQTPALADWQEMEFVNELESLLLSRPELFVVVVSTHREGKSLEGVKALLPASVAARVVGLTPVRADGRADGGRQREIEEWLSASPGCRSWVAVDDEARLYEPGCPWLVPTHAWIGWQCSTTEQILAVLEGRPGPLSKLTPAQEAGQGQGKRAKKEERSPTTFTADAAYATPAGLRAPSSKKPSPKPSPKWKKILNGLLSR